eukprot:132228-Pleurochrysis_carterae.AAC.1
MSGAPSTARPRRTTCSTRTTCARRCLRSLGLSSRGKRRRGGCSSAACLGACVDTASERAPFSR